MGHWANLCKSSVVIVSTAAHRVEVVCGRGAESVAAAGVIVAVAVVKMVRCWWQTSQR